MPKYNGHKNWNHWSVALWIANDESLYRFARSRIKEQATRNDAAKAILADLKEMGVTETPDGAPYTFSSVRAAIVEL